MKYWITFVFTTYVLPLHLLDALASRKKSFSWTQGFSDKGGRTKKRFTWAALANTGEEFWIARMSQISGDNKQQGKAGIIHLSSYVWGGLKKWEPHSSNQFATTVPWITFCIPPSLNSSVPLTGAALSLKVGTFFGQDPLLLPSAVKTKTPVAHLGVRAPMQQLLPMPPAAYPFHHHTLSISKFPLGIFFSSILFICPGLLLPLIISLLPVEHLEQAPLLSAQEGDTLLFSTDLITEVVFPRIKTNTCSNNVPTTHSSCKQPAISAFYQKRRAQSNLKNVYVQPMKEFKYMPILRNASSLDDFNKTVCRIRCITSRHTSESYGCSAKDTGVRSASTKKTQPVPRQDCGCWNPWSSIEWQPRTGSQEDYHTQLKLPRD